MASVKKHTQLIDALLGIIILGVLIISIDVIYRSFTGDTTLLGDPYYEDQILAHDRALLSLIATWSIVGVSIVLGSIIYIQYRKDRKKKLTFQKHNS